MLPVYYINLARRTDRREFMERQFDALGLAATRIEAATPADISETQRLALPGSIWSQAPTDMACVLSHRRAWASVAEGGRPGGLVLEDDVVLDPCIAGYLADDILERTRVPLLRVETAARRVRLGSRATRLWDGAEVRHLLTTFPAGGAYIISRRVAAAAAVDDAALLMEVDRYLFGRGGRWLTEVTVGQAVPAPCIQLEFLEASAAAPLAASDLTPGRRARPINDTPSARRARRSANLHYTMTVLARRLADPASLFAPKLKVPFAGTARLQDA